MKTNAAIARALRELAANITPDTPDNRYRIGLLTQASAVLDAPKMLYVISLNDFPHEVLAAGTSERQAQTRCDELRSRYCKMNPSVPCATVRFHYRELSVTEVR